MFNKKKKSVFILLIILLVFCILIPKSVKAVDIELSATVNNGNVNLSWNKLPGGLNFYTIERDGTGIMSPSDTSSYTDNSASQGDYSYQVVVYSGGSEVGRSNTATVTVTDDGAPDPPGGGSPNDGNVSNSDIVDYMDENIPGVEICMELRRIMEERGLTLTPPWEVGLFTVDETESASGDGAVGDPGNGGGLCADCINSGKSWCRADSACLDSNICSNLCSGTCIHDDPNACPSDGDGDDGGDTDSNTVTTQAGKIFQKWFIDACVMDGYLTAVRHVDLTHRFEVSDSVFSQIAGSDELNLGKLFEIALMEVTKDKEWMEEDPSSLEELSLKDFLLELTHESTMEATEGYDDDKNEELTKASIKDFLLYVKDSNEQFMADLLQALSEKEKLHIQSLKEYELAKIEKAREDVNKLTYEVYRELKEAPLVYDEDLSVKIIRSLGLKVVEASSTEKCPFGVFVYNDSGKECVVIKKEGRVIQNTDDYIHEEAIQKARDFIMCFFAPWRHFPIGEDYYFASDASSTNDVLRNGKFRDGTEPDFSAIRAAMPSPPYCGAERTQEIANRDCKTECGSNNAEKVEKYKSSNLKEIRECRKCIRDKLDEKCNTDNICTKAMQNAGSRPDMFEPTVVATTGLSTTFEEYKAKLCPSDQIKETIKRDMLFDLARKYKFFYQGPPEHWYYMDYDPTSASINDNGNERCALIMANLGYDVDGIVEEQLSNELMSHTLRAYKNYQERIWGTSLPIAVAYRPDATDKDYNKQNASLTSSTGEGVKSFAQNIVDGIIGDYESLRTAEYIAGEGLRADKYLIGFRDRDNKYYFINTENIISPALFLKEKIAAATQAQFDLAQNAWKQQPEGVGTGELGCPRPYIDEMDKSKFSDKKPYTALENKCESEELEHGWYLVELTDSGTADEDKEYECRWPQFNDITCEVFGYITTQPITTELPKELPAPWEDINEYMEVPEEYTAWFEGEVNGLSGEQLGLKKAPPAFDIPEYGTKYSDLTADDAYPNIYQEAYGEDQSLPMPNSDEYYTNKWYKDVTQLYEKPMSEILRTWFKEE